METLLVNSKKLKANLTLFPVWSHNLLPNSKKLVAQPMKNLANVKVLQLKPR